MEKKVNVKEYTKHTKLRLLFLYELENEELWKDGLWAALQLLKKEYAITMQNIAHNRERVQGQWNIVLGWGGFGSLVTTYLEEAKVAGYTVGLCLGGYGFPAVNAHLYSVIFYECPWAKEWLVSQGVQTELVHAFGVNTDIYKPLPNVPRIWNYITVGSFSYWKRQTKIIDKTGPKIAVGAIQKNNMGESIDIVGNLILGHCGVTDEVSPETLAKMYNSSLICYIPAEIVGGGERAVLEARACGIDVEIEPDNPKLAELITSPIWSHHYYYEQLKKGIELVI